MIPAGLDWVPSMPAEKAIINAWRTCSPIVKKQPAFEIASCAISAILRHKDAAVEIVPPAKAESHDRKKL